MRSRLVGLTIVMLGLGLTGCQGNTVSLVRTRVARMLPSALAQIINPPPPEVRCIRSLASAQPHIVDALGDAAENLNDAQFQSGDWGNLSGDAARDARLSHAQPQFEIIHGPGDTALLVGTWCAYRVEPFNLYVVDHNGNARLVGIVDDYLGALDYEWNDGVWSVTITKLIGEIDKSDPVLVGLVVLDNEWRLAFVPEIETYRMQGIDLPNTAPVFMNVDGMDQLLITLEQPDGSALQHIYLWGIGVYAHIEDRQDK